jgi:DNA-binding transcriptional LysR family regulator
MKRSDLADLNTFLVVAERLSFRAAAAQLGVTPSALSHSIRELEERLCVRLLHRTTRSVSLTDAGLRLLNRLRPAIEQVSAALEDLNETRERPFGNLRIHASPVAAAAVIAPMWQRFLATYPDVDIDLSVDVEAVDLAASGFDVGIGPKYWASSDMIAVRVAGPSRVAIVGAPSYFARRSPPRSPDELASHNCVQLRIDRNGALFHWRFERNGKPQTVSVPGKVTVNTPELAIRAAVDGLGIAYTTDWVAEPFLRSGQLVRVLEGWSGKFEGIFLHYNGRRQIPAALRAFIDMIRDPNSGAAKRSLNNPL